MQHITTTLKKSHHTYGVRRPTAALHQQGLVVNHKCIARLKRVYGIYPRVHKPIRVKTTVADPSHPVAVNHLNRQFSPRRPHTAWVGDITYIPTTQGWSYLAVWEDLTTRKVVGWAVARQLRASLVLDAFEQACAQEPNLYPHLTPCLWRSMLSV